MVPFAKVPFGYMFFLRRPLQGQAPLTRLGSRVQFLPAGQEMPADCRGWAVGVLNIGSACGAGDAKPRAEGRGPRADAPGLGLAWDLFLFFRRRSKTILVTGDGQSPLVGMRRKDSQEFDHGTLA